MEGRAVTAKGKTAVVITILLLLALVSCTAYAGTWYRGDLHAHSLYSDGDSSVAEVIARAEELGLDFFVITDHDTSLSGIPRHWSDPGYASDRMVLLYGMEWTTPHGHANVWAPEPFSYDALWQANRSRDAQAAVAAAHAAGALFSINHPVSAIFSLPWQYPVPEDVDGIEVWNSLYRLPSLNRWAGHWFWDGLLRQGKRIPGVGGSDEHMLKGWMSRFWGPGNPTTWVYAESLSAEAILKGIAAGHVTISYGPDAGRVLLSADADGDGVYEAMCGDTIPANGQLVSFRVSVESPNGDALDRDTDIAELDRETVKELATGLLNVADISAVNADGETQVFLAGVFKNGNLFRVFAIFGKQGSWTFEDRIQEPSYYRVELIGTPEVAPFHHLLYGMVVSLCNPIYAVENR